MGWRPQWCLWDGHDTDEALNLVGERGLYGAQRRATAFVRRHRDAINALAAALLERREVTGDDAEAIMSAADPGLMGCEMDTAPPYVMRSQRLRERHEAELQRWRAKRLAAISGATIGGAP